MTDLAGGCLCGAVRYVAQPRIAFKSYACHCTDCQTRSGSAFAIQLPVIADDLTITGDMIVGHHVQPSGAVAQIFACRTCLTRIHVTNDQRPGIVTLRAGTLDDSPTLVPGFHVWVTSKQAWVVIPDDVPSLAAQPADAAEWQKLLLGF